MQTNSVSGPAHLLEGKVLEGGWHVESKLDGHPNATGGHHSTGYFVRNENGQLGFLKALDLSRAFQSDDLAREMERLLQAFNFERDLLTRCRDRRLNRIVYALASGMVMVDGFGGFGNVPWLIFERADGDVRRYLSLAQAFDLAWILRSLHQISVGLFQLHQIGVAHHDLKPSNILVFAIRNSKISDLGCSAIENQTSPRGNIQIPGDQTYAPPDEFYGVRRTDWARQHCGSDAYLLGSMCVFFFTGVSTSALIRAELNPALLTKHNFQADLPYIQDAFGRGLHKFQEHLEVTLGTGYEEISAGVTQLVRELCDPDPTQRCDPKSRVAGKLMLERYITRLNILARKVEMRLVGR